MFRSRGVPDGAISPRPRNAARRTRSGDPRRREWPGASADHWVFRFDERAYRAAYRDAYGVEFSLLNGYGDRPDWVVRRGDREFRYHDNMADRDLPNVRHHLLRALAEGGRLGMPVRLRMLAEEREKLDLHQEGYC